MSQLIDSTIVNTLAGVTKDEIDAFAAHIAGLSDEQIRSQWHLSDGPVGDDVIALARKLQSVSGF